MDKKDSKKFKEIVDRFEGGFGWEVEHLPWSFKQFSQFPANKFIVDARDKVMMEVYWLGFSSCEMLAKVPEDMRWLIDKLKEALPEEQKDGNNQG